MYISSGRSLWTKSLLKSIQIVDRMCCSERINNFQTFGQVDHQCDISSLRISVGWSPCNHEPVFVTQIWLSRYHFQHNAHIVSMTCVALCFHLRNNNGEGFPLIQILQSLVSIACFHLSFSAMSLFHTPWTDGLSVSYVFL